MTKYVLNSGGTKHFPDLKRSWHREMLKGLSRQPAILICNFAQAEDSWELRFQEYKASIIEDALNGVRPRFELALSDKFEEQCKASDVIYIHGGNDQLLRSLLNKFDMPNLFRNKVIATSSAASALMSSYYFGCLTHKCNSGLALVRIKIIPHYQSNFGSNTPLGPIDWDKAYLELQEFGEPELPLYALKEGEFIVIEQQDR